jgi:hypothetical protein
MAGRKLVLSVTALIFLLVALAGLYRLMVWFPISIGGAEVGQVASFFIIVICAGLSLMLFGEARRAGSD